tara:strand:- start:1073 stop:1567 length:495 start_codon:yes stop_codon:yes gene_type:complete
MPQVQLSTNTRRWDVLAEATSDHAQPIIQTADPKNDPNVHVTRDRNLAKLVFATSADNLTASVSLYGWSQLQGGHWMPTLIGKFALTGGAIAGLAGAPINQTCYLVDTIALNDGDESVRIISGIAGETASITCDLEGADRLEVRAHDLGGTGESAKLVTAVSMF